MEKMYNYVITEFNACGDGLTDNTEAFRRALRIIASNGGGRLTVPQAEWKTGPLELGSNTELHLENGAVLSFIDDFDMYPPVASRWEGVECHAFHPLVFSRDSVNVRITGKGIIDGCGKKWWDAIEEKRSRRQEGPVLACERRLAALNPEYPAQAGGGGGRETQFLRPPLVQFISCTDSLLEGVTLRDSPFWTLHPVYCAGLTIRDITIINPGDSPNTDGIDIDSCTDVTITGCTINVGDDGIALKSGSGEDGLRVNRPTRSVHISGCNIHEAHGGLVIGSETSGGVSDITMEDCILTGTDRGVRIKTRRGRGGNIRSIHARNLSIKGCLTPVAINMYYKWGASLVDTELFYQSPQPVVDSTPSIADIVVEGVTAVGCRASAGFIFGLPEAPVREVTVKDCSFTVDMDSPVSPSESDMFLGVPEVKEKSFRMVNVQDVSLHNVRVIGPEDAVIRY